MSLEIKSLAGQGNERAKRKRGLEQSLQAMDMVQSKSVAVILGTW